MFEHVLNLSSFKIYNTDNRYSLEKKIPNK